MKRAISLSLALVIFTAIGSVNMLPAVPYIVFGAVVVFTLLVATNKIDKRYLPIYIFGLSLSLLWQTSMIGTYIVGVDIHTEYFVANHIINNGWNPSWANNSNTSIVLAWVTPLLNKIGITPVWAFKAVYPFVCAFAPVIIYYAFKRRLGESRAYYASLFLMTMPMFTMEVVSIVKSQWAYMFLALLVFFLTSNYKHWKKALGITGATIGAALSHYAIAIIVFAYIVAILGIRLVTNWGKLKSFIGVDRLPLKYLMPCCVVAMGVIFAWFSFVGDGTIIKTVFAIGGNITQVSQEVIIGDTGHIEHTNPTQNNQSSLITEYLEYTNPVKSRSYLDNQSPLIRTAIGLDFMEVSVWGKIFRVFQYLSQIFLVAGFVWLLFKRGYGFTSEYVIGVIASFVLLACCIFVPFFTTTLSATRFYAVTLFFISPLLIIGVEQVGRRVVAWAR